MVLVLVWSLGTGERFVIEISVRSLSKIFSTVGLDVDIKIYDMYTFVLDLPG